MISGRAEGCSGPSHRCTSALVALVIGVGTGRDCGRGSGSLTGCTMVGGAVVEVGTVQGWLCRACHRH